MNSRAQNIMALQCALPGLPEGRDLQVSLHAEDDLFDIGAGFRREQRGEQHALLGR